jgi:hypothetical protein
MQEAIDYDKAIIDNAKQWARGRNCQPLYQEDIAIIGSYVGINIPKAFYNFEMTDKLNSCKATSSFKAIFKTLDIIQKKLLEGN